MKQKILLLMALVAATITFSACSSDDDDDNNGGSIVGTWLGEYDGYDVEFYFQSNGNVTTTETMQNDPTTKARDTGTYQLNGNRLTFRWTKSETWSNRSQKWITDDESVETVVLTVSISGNRLTFYPDESASPIVFTRQ